MDYSIYRLFKKTEGPQYKHSLTIAAVGWLMIMVFGAIPYFIIAWITPVEVMQQFVPDGFDYASSLINFRNPLHFFFESTSAFTTTGLTWHIMNHQSERPFFFIVPFHNGSSDTFPVLKYAE